MKGLTMPSETEVSWFRSRKFKLFAPMAGAAALLIVANLFSSPEANGRPETARSFLHNMPFGDRIEKTFGPRIERTSTLAGKAWDKFNQYWSAGQKGFEKDPDGELDR
jgi:hypothetical protein